jgi:hypothetical protein
MNRTTRVLFESSKNEVAASIEGEKTLIETGLVMLCRQLASRQNIATNQFLDYLKRVDQKAVNLEKEVKSAAKSDSINEDDSFEILHLAARLIDHQVDMKCDGNCKDCNKEQALPSFKDFLILLATERIRRPNDANTGK